MVNAFDVFEYGDLILIKNGTSESASNITIKCNKKKFATFLIFPIDIDTEENIFKIQDLYISLCPRLKMDLLSQMLDYYSTHHHKTKKLPLWPQLLEDIENFEEKGNKSASELDWRNRIFNYIKSHDAAHAASHYDAGSASMCVAVNDASPVPIRGTPDSTADNHTIDSYIQTALITQILLENFVDSLILQLPLYSASMLTKTLVTITDNISRNYEIKIGRHTDTSLVHQDQLPTCTLSVKKKISRSTRRRARRQKKSPLLSTKAPTTSPDSDGGGGDAGFPRMLWQADALGWWQVYGGCSDAPLSILRYQEPGGGDAGFPRMLWQADAHGWWQVGGGSSDAALSILSYHVPSDDSDSMPGMASENPHVYATPFAKTSAGNGGGTDYSGRTWEDNPN